MKTKQVLTVIAICVTALVCTVIAGNAFRFRYTSGDVITVTGLGEQEFASDIIVWRGSFGRKAADLQQAYRLLDEDTKKVKSYLAGKGIKEEEIVFSFVNVFQEQEPTYVNGNYSGSRFTGYRLNQSFRIESKEVEKIEAVSREISELIAQGIPLESYSPEYFYSMLADMKIELINKATEDAYTRARAIADRAGAKLGNLRTGRMGVIQITAPNSNEELSWGGSYNSESKHKKASITMRLEYHLK